MFTFPFTIFGGAFLNTLSSLFNKVDEDINFGDNQNFEHDVPFSLSIWIKPDTITSQMGIWAKATNDANVWGWSFYIKSDGGLLLQARTTTTLRNIVSTSTTVSAGVWSLLTLTYSGNSNASGISFYLNGVLDSETSTGSLGGSILSSVDSKFAARNNAFRYGGNLNQAVFWDKELSQIEVTEVYNLGKPFDPRTSSMASNIVNYYKLGNDDIAGTVLDSVGSADGTFTNGDLTNYVEDTP